MGNQAGIIIRNVKNELFHSAKRLILNEVKGIECLRSDLGNWQSLYEKLQKDENGNAAVGNVRFIESSNTIVHMESAKRVVIQGIHDSILSEKNGQFLICHRSEEQRIKEFSAE